MWDNLNPDLWTFSDKSHFHTSVKMAVDLGASAVAHKMGPALRSKAMSRTGAFLFFIDSPNAVALKMSSAKTTQKTRVKMSKSPVLLASNLADITQFAQSAYDKADGRIILVPVDFSEHSAAALRFAASLADLMPAALMVMHVIHDPGEMPGYYSKLVEQKNPGRIQDLAGQAFNDFLSQVLESGADYSSLQEADVFMVIGLPVTRILEVAAELNPVMVVMGSKGRTGIESLVIGSKAAQVVQLCPAPVTIVKNQDHQIDS